MIEDIKGCPLSQLLLSVSLGLGSHAVYYSLCFYVGDASETEIPLQVIYP